MSTIGKRLVLLDEAELREVARLAKVATMLGADEERTPEAHRKYTEAIMALAVASHKATYHIGVYPDSPMVVVSFKDLAVIHEHTVEVVKPC